MAAATENDNSPRVLLVDDEPRLRQLLGQTIEQLGFACEAVGSAERAWRRVQSNPPAMAILDLNLPEMDGMTLLEKLHGEVPELPVIILTAFGDLPTAQRAIRLEVVDFLTKPYELGDLEQALDRAYKRTGRGATSTDHSAEAGGVFDTADDTPTALDQLEREHVLQTLDYYDGDRRKTARALNISLRTLYYRLARYREEGELS